MRVDLLVIFLGLILIIAMVLTLLFGREYSRHGYGAVPRAPTGTPLTCPVFNFNLGTNHGPLSHEDYGAPCRNG